MGLQDRIKEDFDAILERADVTETIHYRAVTEFGPQSLQEMECVPEDSTEELSLALGSTRGEPFVPVISRNDLASVREKHDFLVRQHGTEFEKEYRVEKILSPEDTGAWRLYCVG